MIDLLLKVLVGIVIGVAVVAIVCKIVGKISKKSIEENTAQKLEQEGYEAKFSEKVKEKAKHPHQANDLLDWDSPYTAEVTDVSSTSVYVSVYDEDGCKIMDEQFVGDGVDSDIHKGDIISIKY